MIRAEGKSTDAYSYAGRSGYSVRTDILNVSHSPTGFANWVKALIFHSEHRSPQFWLVLSNDGFCKIHLNTNSRKLSSLPLDWLSRSKPARKLQAKTTKRNSFFRTRVLRMTMTPRTEAPTKTAAFTVPPKKGYAERYLSSVYWLLMGLGKKQIRESS